MHTLWKGVFFSLTGENLKRKYSRHSFHHQILWGHNGPYPMYINLSHVHSFSQSSLASSFWKETSRPWCQSALIQAPAVEDVGSMQSHHPGYEKRSITHRKTLLIFNSVHSWQNFGASCVYHKSISIISISTFPSRPNLGRQRKAIHLWRIYRHHRLWCFQRSLVTSF